ncbi:Multidrug resistance-associated protein 1 [Nymphon striatum]|nr:Multidrug resistance-associated protein 1 [Nymphon striatum]
MGNPFLEESTDLLRLDTRDIADPTVVSTVQKDEEICFAKSCNKNMEGMLNVSIYKMSKLSSCVSSDGFLKHTPQFTNSMERISCFLNSEEVPKKSHTIYKYLNSLKTEECSLNDINLRVKEGEFVAIIGDVGAGKSSLISALNGEMILKSGIIEKNGNVSIAPQTPWILNTTVRENILFFDNIERGRYEKTVDACQLFHDLDSFPDNDKTVVGIKGIELSGGQKQRISLARAIFNESDIYIFDDPLSSVDSNVGTKIFQMAIGPKGILKSKTRILITNDMRFISECDKIFIIKNGRILIEGSYEKVKPYLENIICTNTTNVDNLMNSDLKSNSSYQDYYSKPFMVEFKTSVFFRFIKLIGFPTTFFILTSYCLSKYLGVRYLFQMKSWTSEETNAFGKEFILLWFGEVIFLLIGAFTLVYGTIKASRIVHNRMVDSLLKAPVWWYDTTSVGEIYCRLGQDLDQIDKSFSEKSRDLLYCLTKCISSILILLKTIPMVLPILIPMSITLNIAHDSYSKAIAQFHNDEEKKKAKIYDHIAETLSGLTSIRTFNKQENFKKKLQSLIIKRFQLEYYSIAVSRLMMMKTQFISRLMCLLVGIAISIYRDSMEAGTASLVLYFMYELTHECTSLFQVVTLVKRNENAFIRIFEYTELPKEDEWEKENPKTETNSKIKYSKIEFIDYSARYIEESPDILQNLNFEIRNGEKIGIVGRTGAGKSSLIAAIFRMVKFQEGKIMIDNVNINNIGLHNLRSKITFIPQKPFLFSGTIRENLDPSGKYSKQDLIGILSKISLQNQTFKIELDDIIEDDGNNISSIGQRQLVCLARAILNKTDIIIFDEATASVDVTTDRLIQKIIKTEFKDKTVITIAHRISTILYSTRIFVMDGGKIIENGSPGTLLKDQNSTFYHLAKISGIITKA